MCCSRRKRLLEEQRKKQQQPKPQPRIEPKPFVRGRETSNSSQASAAINSALRFPSPGRLPRPNSDEVNAEVLERAGIEPPSYEDVMTGGKLPKAMDNRAGPSSSRSHAEASSSSQAKEMDPIPDNVTVFSDDPTMYTPPTTRAPTVIHEDSESDVDSVVEEFRQWQLREQNPNSAATGHWAEQLGNRIAERAAKREQKWAEWARKREEKRNKRAEKAARKAEKWAGRAVRSGHVFEPNWSSGTGVGVGA